MKMLLKWLKPQKPQLYDQPQPNVAIFITSFTFIQTGMILCFQRKLLFSATGLNLPMDQKNADFRRKEQHGMHEVSFCRSLDVPAVIHNFVISHTGFFIATAGSIVQDSKTRLQGDDIHTTTSIYLMKAANTAHITSLAFSLAASASSSRSSRSRTRFIATS